MLSGRRRFGHVRDLAGNIIRVAVLSEEEARPSGSSLTVDNLSDPPAEVTTIVAPGATIEAGTATLPEGVQRIRLLGPLIIKHDTPGVADDTGVDSAGVIDFSTGQLVLDLCVEIVERWNNGAVYLTAYAANSEELIRSNWFGDEAGMVLSSSGTQADEGDYLRRNFGQLLDTNARPKSFLSAKTIWEQVYGFSRVLPARVVQDCSVTFYLSDAASAIEGEVHVYALVAEPA